MRSRKELIYLNIDNITEEEKEKLADYELNCCDKCGEIDLSINLIWLDGITATESPDAKTTTELLKEGYVAVCKDCYNIKKSKIHNLPAN